MSERRVPWNMPVYLERVRRGCFVCEMLAGTPGFEHDVVHRDDVGVVFLARYPVTRGHVLVAPAEHRESGWRSREDGSTSTPPSGRTSPGPWRRHCRSSC
jgi:histidine triad (HIT) family protein/ATP adenylyltransferase